MELLIVDDDIAVCDTLEEYFSKQLNYRVHCAHDGRKAMVLLRQHRIDVLLCDLHLPDMSGVQLVEKLFELDTNCPVIMMSKQASKEELISFLRLPIYDFFEKPIKDIAGLACTVQSIFDEYQLNKDREQLHILNKKLEKSLSGLQVDLQAGRYVQRKMLPDTPKHFGEYELSHRLLPSSYLSGDFVEYVLIGDQFVCFFIADVSGHGASSAFITVLLKNITARLRSDWVHTRDARITSPAKFLMSVNEEFIDLQSGKHATLFVGVLDMNSNSLRYSMAGHHPLPILKDQSGVRYLEAKGKPIGLFPEYRIQEYELQLPSTFSLILFSDGILDVLEANTVENKERMLLDKVAMCELTSVQQLSETMGIQEQLAFPDDIAMLILQRKPLNNA